MENFNTTTTKQCTTKLCVYPMVCGTVKPVYNDHLYNKILSPVIYSVMRFNEDWRYQFTLANNICLLELI